MGDPVLLDRRLTIDEFLAWKPDDDRRYQLIDGVVRAMAPTRRAHGRLVAALSRFIGNHLADSARCAVETEPGITVPDSDRTFFVADLAVSCAPHDPAEIATPDPILIAEILSPSTEAEDRRIKVPAYLRIPTLREIVLLAQDRPAVEVLRRRDGAEWLQDGVRGLDGVLRLESIDLAFPLASLYRGLSVQSGG